MATGGLEVDYADMAAARAGFSTVARDLEAGDLAPEQASTAVYGEATVAVAVTRVTDALRSRHQALADTAWFLSTTLGAETAAYRAVDAQQESVYERLLGRLDRARHGMIAPRPGAGPTSAQVR